MKIDVKHVARLSNLTLTTPEEKVLENQLNNILEYVKKIEEVNVADITPTSQVTGLENVTRKDGEIKKSLSQEEALSATNSKYNEMFKVKAVIEND